MVNPVGMSNSSSSDLEKSIPDARTKPKKTRKKKTENLSDFSDDTESDIESEKNDCGGKEIHVKESADITKDLAKKKKDSMFFYFGIELLVILFCGEL